MLEAMTSLSNRVFSTATAPASWKAKQRFPQDFLKDVNNRSWQLKVIQNESKEGGWGNGRVEKESGEGRTSYISLIVGLIRSLSDICRSRLRERSE